MIVILAILKSHVIWSVADSLMQFLEPIPMINLMLKLPQRELRLIKLDNDKVIIGFPLKWLGSFHFEHCRGNN